ncbi:MAG: 5-bromo-4-chloroindolyl phosphate hydrolysis family protein [Oscillospiraceae bacterium]|jgi:5-bromo-4-chloroindolyl phosphate hydrolysis protein|nr:5-bromo-4-chloroindolyl phosphate hydrolysis family protein [Oscillospiraceae bacterium]
MRNNNYNNEGFGLGELIGWLVPILMIFTGIAAPIGIIILISKLSKTGKQRNTRTSAPTSAAPVSTSAAAIAASVSAPAAARRQAAQPPDARLKKDKKNAKRLAFWLFLLAIALFAVGLSAAVPAVRELFTAGGAGDGVWHMLLGGFYCLGGAVALGARGVWPRRVSLCRKYLAVIGGRDIMPISDVSSGVGTAPKKTRRDLQAMIDSGYFPPTAYIDAELDCLVFSRDAAKSARLGREQAQKIVPPQEETSENQYMKILRELRALNDTIADETISGKIDRIEATSAKIFKTVEENPAKLPQIRRFMSYYLPTTLKLLHTYATLEKQNIHGENITSARENIDRILGTLATGFEQQLDQLFQSDAIDITSDINVLENMMARDGLTGAGPLSQQPGQGTTQTR